MTPASARNLLVKYANVGVGVTPNKLAFAPAAKKPETKAFSIIKPEVLVSRPTITLSAWEVVTMARPILAARSGVKSELIKPRTPELPKSFISAFPHFMVDTNAFK